MPNYLAQGNKRKRFKRHGFLKRMKSKTGRRVLKRRRSRGRTRIAQ